MKKNYSHFIFNIFFVLLSTSFSSAQISEGGQPVFLSSSSVKTGTVSSLPSNFQIPIYTLPKINNDSLIQQDLEREDHFKALRFATAIDIDVNINNSGIWKTLDNGTEVWLMEIYSENASSLNFILNYKLEPGAKLFMYNPSTGKVLGAYTHKNNKTWGRLAVQPLAGERVVFEYHVPKGVDKGVLGIKTVGHGYLNNNDVTEFSSYGFGASKECQYNINSEKGQGWQNEKRSVVKIIIQISSDFFSTPSGVLINNTAEDSTPYILTCEHAINSQSIFADPDYTLEMRAQNSVYLFNYESEVIGKDGDQSQTISGAVIKAMKPTLDFCLLELSSDIPDEYEPYFAGWDLSDEQERGLTAISHPKGDVKKIAGSMAQAVPYQNFNDEYSYDFNTFWEISRWTYEGLEKGSSGSPLFNHEHLVIGTATGATSFPCDSQIPESGVYQMISFMWEASLIPNQQLKYWLDPLDSGVNQLNGFEPYPREKVYMYPDRQLIYTNEPVVFKDLSIGNYTNYRWVFGEYAEPSTATGSEDVSVTYHSPRIFSASLTATDENGNDITFTLKNYIEVFDQPIVADFEADKRIASVGEFVTFYSTSTGPVEWENWNIGEGEGEGPGFSGEEITVKYLTEGKKDISLTITSDIDQRSIVKIGYVEIGEKLEVTINKMEDTIFYTNQPIQVSGTSNKDDNIFYWYYWYLNDIDDPFSDNLFSSEISISDSGIHTIYLYGYCNGYSVVDSVTIEVEEMITSIEDFTVAEDSEFQIYPNPCTDQLYIDLPSEFEKSSLQIFDQNGRILFFQEMNSTQYILNCSKIQRGINILEINNGTEKIIRKILFH